MTNASPKQLDLAVLLQEIAISLEKEYPSESIVLYVLAGSLFLGDPFPQEFATLAQEFGEYALARTRKEKMH